jgi:hypothetical protein
VGTGGLSRSVKWPEHEVDQSCLSRVEVKNTHLCLQVLERDDDIEVCLYLKIPCITVGHANFVGNNILQLVIRRSFELLRWKRH